jgi:hypothetical protein
MVSTRWERISDGERRDKKVIVEVSDNGRMTEYTGLFSIFSTKEKGSGLGLQSHT